MSITVVSGLPRSGTSLVMQMLFAANFPVLTDGVRKPDVNNRNGYFEWEPAKKLPQTPAVIAQAEGKAVKVVSLLLSSLPLGFDYRILYVERDLAEVTRSQIAMIANVGVSGPPGTLNQIYSTLSAHRKQVNVLIASRRDFSLLRVEHRALLTASYETASQIAAFVGLGSHLAIRMSSEVDPALWRERT